MKALTESRIVLRSNWISTGSGFNRIVLLANRREIPFDERGYGKPDYEVYSFTILEEKAVDPVKRERRATNFIQFAPEIFDDQHITADIIKRLNERFDALLKREKMHWEFLEYHVASICSYCSASIPKDLYNDVLTRKAWD